MHDYELPKLLILVLICSAIVPLAIITCEGVNCSLKHYRISGTANATEPILIGNPTVSQHYWEALKESGQIKNIDIETAENEPKEMGKKWIVKTNLNASSETMGKPPEMHEKMGLPIRCCPNRLQRGYRLGFA